MSPDIQVCMYIHNVSMYIHVHIYKWMVNTGCTEMRDIFRAIPNDVLKGGARILRSLGDYYTQTLHIW